MEPSCVRTVKFLGVSFLLFVGSGVAGEGGAGSAPTADAERRIHAEYLALRPFDRPLAVENLVVAQQIQNRLVAVLEPQWGPVVGYKAGLTNPANQRRFNVNQPVRGTLLKRMLVETGAIVPKEYAALPALEGDLLVRVRDPKFLDHPVREERMRGLDAVLPFLELPDFAFQPNVAISGPQLVAINVGARMGVVGEALPVADDAESRRGWVERLAQFQVEVFDGSGKSLGQGEGTSLLGHPLEVVGWLVESLRREGRTLRAGDLLSLGSLTRAVAVRPGENYRGVYRGLHPTREVEVRFQVSRGRLS